MTISAAEQHRQINDAFVYLFPEGVPMRERIYRILLEIALLGPNQLLGGAEPHVARDFFFTECLNQKECRLSFSISAMPEYQLVKSASYPIQLALRFDNEHMYGHYGAPHIQTFVSWVNDILHTFFVRTQDHFLWSNGRYWSGTLQRSLL